MQRIVLKLQFNNFSQPVSRQVRRIDLLSPFDLKGVPSRRSRRTTGLSDLGKKGQIHVRTLECISNSDQAKAVFLILGFMGPSHFGSSESGQIGL